VSGRYLVWAFVCSFFLFFVCRFFRGRCCFQSALIIRLFLWSKSYFVLKVCVCILVLLGEAEDPF
jgi:hypothetical protein